MRFDRFLLRANLLAFALLLIVLLGGIGYGFVQQARYSDAFADEATGGPSLSDGTPRGEELDGPNGPLTLYAVEAEDQEARRDVRIVDMKSGRIVTLADDRDALVYQQSEVGSLGYVALVKTGMRGDRPIFDLVFARYSDMTRHVLAQGIDAMDRVTPLDDKTFSAIVWDSLNKGRFVIVDGPGAKIVLSRKLDYSNDKQAPRVDRQPAAEQAARSAGAAVQDADETAAPVNKFH